MQSGQLGVTLVNACDLSHDMAGPDVSNSARRATAAPVMDMSVGARSQTKDQPAAAMEHWLALLDLFHIRYGGHCMLAGDGGHCSAESRSWWMPTWQGWAVSISGTPHIKALTRRSPLSEAGQQTQKCRQSELSVSGSGFPSRPCNRLCLSPDQTT